MRFSTVVGMDWLVAPVQRQIEPEAGAAAGAILETDVTLHELDQALADGEAKAGAALLARCGGVGLGEAPENAAVEGFRDAGASIVHGDANDGAIDAHVDVDHGPLGGELGCI